MIDEDEVELESITKKTFPSSSSSPSLKSFSSAIAGGIAGCVGKSITAPLSRLTILYQVNSACLSGETQCKSTFASEEPLRNAITRIYKTEGIAAFWRGNLTSIIHRFPYSAINFASYESGRKLLSRWLDCEGHETAAIRLSSGAIAGAIACTICYPLDLIRTRLTVNYSVKYSGILDAFQKIMATDGIKGLYKGLGMSLLVSVPNLSVGFAVYGTMKDFMLQPGGSALLRTPQKSISDTACEQFTITPLGSLITGASSGIVSSLTTFPIDLIRRRMQLQSVERTLNETNSRSAAINEIVKIARTEGPKGFYRGLLPELLKVIPMVTVTFLVYDIVKDGLS